jgi:hypothetical protein
MAGKGGDSKERFVTKADIGFCLTRLANKKRIAVLFTAVRFCLFFP